MSNECCPNILDVAPFVDRRRRLSAHIATLGGGVVLLATAPEAARNRDTHYPYRFDSYFYYLTGFAEPESVIVIQVGEVSKSILFCREKNPEREIWDGYRFGPEAAAKAFGFDEAYPITELTQRLPELIANQPALYAALGHTPQSDAWVMESLRQVRSQSRAGRLPPPVLHDLLGELDAMRLIKDPTEVDTLQSAADITSEAHRLAMQTARPGRWEYEVQAAIEYHFRKSGAQAPSYPSIVASGANACVLHYVENNRQMQAGDLLLIDAGCELDGYAADITRTFPVNGRFSSAQRDLYTLVLNAQTAAIASLRPGVSLNDYHDAAVSVLAQGFLDLGLLQGSLESVLENKAYQRFYMHRTGHWLGLDVHDAGATKNPEGDWVTLTPGMVLTVEPGCYIRPAEDVPQAFWNMGIRIEDDALITPTGVRVLTAEAPKQVAEIESLMLQAKQQ